MKKLVVLAATALTLAVGPAAAYTPTMCSSLWLERNTYYKDAGYCFKTPRAISQFGNAGCLYDDQNAVPLPRPIRDRISAISRVEHMLGCE